MKTVYGLPGVFGNSLHKAVNGSLWSIPYEIFAYFLLSALFLTKALSLRYFSSLIFSLVVIDSLAGNRLLFTWLPNNPEITLLAPCFAFGAFLAVWKSKVKINAFVVSGALVLSFLFMGSEYNYYYFYFALFLGIVYISSLKWFVALKPSVDISYGVYLWGWPVQQVIAICFFDSGIRFNQISSIIVSAIIAIISWYLIEAKCIEFGVALGQREWVRKLGTVVE